MSPILRAWADGVLVRSTLHLRTAGVRASTTDIPYQW